MKARGKSEAQRNASPLVTKKYFEQSAESAKYHVNYSALSELHAHCAILPGATRLTLFGACPWLSYSAPLALSSDFLCKASKVVSASKFARLPEKSKLTEDLR